MTVLVSHSFTRGDSNSALDNADTGQPSLVLAGRFGTKNNAAYLVTGLGTALTVWESNNSDVTVTVDKATNSNRYGGGISFRATDASNYFLFRWAHDGGGLQLYKFVSGAAQQVGTSKAISVTANQIYKFKVVTNGSSIKCYVDDVEKFSTTDSFNQTATKHGIRQHVYSAGTDDEFFDNFLVEDLATTPIGTDGSITLGLTQQIYSGSSVNLSLTQQIYADISANLDLIQNIYRDTEAMLGLNQMIYKDDTALLPLTQAIYRNSELGLNLRQEIYTEAESILNLIQEFYEDSQTYITLQLIQQIYKDSSTDLPLTQAIYQDNEISLSTRQEIYEDKENTLNLTQNVYKDESSFLGLSQTIYRDTSTRLNLVQQMYVDGEISLALLIRIRDDLVQIIGSVRLKGQRVLNALLKGQRKLNVILKGSVGVTAENQNFTMTAGDYFEPVFPTTEIKYNPDTKALEEKPIDLTGCTVKWGLLQKKYSPTNLFLKTSEAGDIVLLGDTILIKLTPVDTADLAGSYYHECEIIDQQGHPSTIFRGMCSISKSGV